MIKRYTNADLNILATILKNDGVISVPTDTVYGLCAQVNSPNAYQKLKQIKNRPNEKAFPIMCEDLEQIQKIAIVGSDAKKLIKNFMPGPITLVLKKRSDAITYINNQGTEEKLDVAVRNGSYANFKKVNSRGR